MADSLVGSLFTSLLCLLLAGSPAVAEWSPVRASSPCRPSSSASRKVSTDHTLDRYQGIVVPMYKAMRPPPKVDVVQFEMGTHMSSYPEEGRPAGIAPAVVSLWNDAIMGGYYKAD